MKYSSIYEKARSPFWWCSYLDRDSGKRVSVSTKIPVADFGSRARARAWANEKSKTAIDAGPVQPSEWHQWVDAVFEGYAEGSRDRVKRVWKRMHDFLIANKVTVPRAVSHATIAAYVVSRRAVGVCDNSICTELAYFSKLMTVAVRRGWANSNPCYRHGYHKSKAKEKREISADEETKIRAALSDQPEWMQVSFAVAMKQGCRLAETQVPLSDIDEDKRQITFKIKGGRYHTTRLHDSLVPLVREARAAGRAKLCAIPAHQGASARWCEFFKKNKLGHLSFHCTRVTVITRLARAGVPVSQAMKYVGHSSSLIHRIYQKLRPDDLSAVSGALS